jgi:hypothetical protein
MLIWRGVLLTWSSPRITCVMHVDVASTTTQKLYVGVPARASRVVQLRVGDLDWPFTASSHATTPSSGLRKRITGATPGGGVIPWLSAASDVVARLRASPLRRAQRVIPVDMRSRYARPRASRSSSAARYRYLLHLEVRTPRHRARHRVDGPSASADELSASTSTLPG